VIVQATFDPLAPGSAATLALMGARVGGLLMIAPVFSAMVVPRNIRVAVLVVLTVLLQPAALASVRDIPRITPAALLSETVIGLAIGLGAAIIVGAAEAAGDVMAIQIGLSGAAILDPLDASQTPVLGSFARLFAIAVLLSLNLHTVMLGTLADSAQLFPVGSPVSLVSGVRMMVQSGGALFVLGVRFAAPVIAVVLIANIAIAILGRAAPQLNILSVAFPVQIMLGLITLAASIPAIGHLLAGWASINDSMLGPIVRALAQATAIAPLGVR
jgi:flagellar biosynthetic protein FliR